MASFTVTLDVSAPATRVWAALTDWPQHGDWAPLTTVRVTSPDPGGVGASFLARSGLGPLGFVDPMTVTRWEPPAGDAPGDRPGHCSIDKHGPAIPGVAVFDVLPLPRGRCRVVWFEDVTVRPHALTRYGSFAISAVGRIGFRRALRAMARSVESQDV